MKRSVAVLIVMLFLSSFASTTMQLVHGSPSPEEISYNPLDLVKEDGLANDEYVTPGGTINYAISFNNSRNAYEVHNVTIIDNLPLETEFISASDSGTYDLSTHSVTWKVGTVAAEAESYSVTLIVRVKSDTTSGITIINNATIDSDETPPTTYLEYTEISIDWFEIINAKVDEIEAKLDQGGPFYIFINDWFTSIQTSISDLASGVADVEAKLDQGGSFYTFVNDWYESIQTSISELSSNIADVEAKLDEGGPFYRFVEDWFKIIDAKVDQVERKLDEGGDFYDFVEDWFESIDLKIDLKLDEFNRFVDDWLVIINAKVDEIERKLDEGGSFHNFVDDWFTDIGNNVADIGSRLGDVGDVVAVVDAKVDQVERKLDEGGSFHNFVDDWFDDIYSFLTVDIENKLDTIKCSLGGFASSGTLTPRSVENLTIEVTQWDEDRPKRVSFWLDTTPMASGDSITVRVWYALNETYLLYRRFTFSNDQTEDAKLIIDQLPVATLDSVWVTIERTAGAIRTYSYQWIAEE